MIVPPQFDLNALEQQKSKILCGSCWRHIRDFHSFQQNILKIQTKLEAQWNCLKMESAGITKNPATMLTFPQIISFELKGETNVEPVKDIEDRNSYLSEKCEEEEEEDDDKPLVNYLFLKNENLSLYSGSLKAQSATLSDQSMPKSCRKSSTIKSSEKPSLRRRPSVHYNSMEKTKELDAFIAELRPQLECDLCNLQLSDFDSLRGHFNRVHQKRCYLKCCERKFYRRCVYVEHLRLHLNPDLYKCDICGRSSTSKHNLILHKQVVHSSFKERHECEICHRRFNQKPTLIRHMATHATGSKDNICPQCGKGYVLGIQLKAHIKTVHSVDRVCDQCGKTLHGISALRQHLREHAGIKKPKWPCDICGSELISRNSLNRHKLSFHHDGSIAFVCKECGKVAASENALLLHKKNVHEAERKFKCSYCEKAFKKNKVLQEHIATHTGQDLYQCPYCPQTFKVNANLHHHRKKAHPVQWAEARQNRLQIPKINLNTITKEIII